MVWLRLVRLDGDANEEMGPVYAGGPRADPPELDLLFRVFFARCRQAPGTWCALCEWFPPPLKKGWHERKASPTNSGQQEDKTWRFVACEFARPPFLLPKVL